MNKKWRPRWRAPLTGAHGNGVLSEAFLAARRPYLQIGPQCTAIARSTGKKCRRLARRGTKHCPMHGKVPNIGVDLAAAAESEAYGKPVIVLRRPRAQALGTLGATMPWPDGVPKRDDLLALGPRARGALFEAWLNRLTAPDVWEHELTRKRYRKLQPRS